jgi:hypothetical protein
MSRESSRRTPSRSPTAFAGPAGAPSTVVAIRTPLTATAAGSCRCRAIACTAGSPAGSPHSFAARRVNGPASSATTARITAPCTSAGRHRFRSTHNARNGASTATPFTFVTAVSPVARPSPALLSQAPSARPSARDAPHATQNATTRSVWVLVASSVTSGAVSTVAAASSCPYRPAPSWSAMRDTTIAQPSAADHCSRLANSSGPASSRRWVSRYSAPGEVPVWRWMLVG